MNRYAFCGLTIASELPLPSARPAPAADGAREADVVLRRADAAWSREQLAAEPNEPVASDLLAGWGGITRSARGYAIVYRDSCAFVISSDARRVDAHVPESTALECAAHLFIGTPMSLLIALRGALALHASAVVLDGGAIAVAGRSGVGKSTLASWLVRDGGALLADDLLRVQPDAHSAWCDPGAVELRMRPDVALPASLESAKTTRTSYDGRRVLGALHSSEQGATLRAIVCPELAAEGEPPQLHALSGVDAFRALARALRPSDLIAEDLRSVQFRQLGALLRCTPVYALRGGWREREVMTTLRALRSQPPAVRALQAWSESP